ncbi:MAG: hypothetical protein JW818_01370, partial [Pirellulales bacterium]|nr:hypothetical protein [Pirellulales bacterium]
APPGIKKSPPLEESLPPAGSFCVVAVVATKARRKDRHALRWIKKMKRSVKSVLKWAPAAMS